jgi:uncharacterized membrane protein YbaN (DUF454 family)
LDAGNGIVEKLFLDFAWLMKAALSRLFKLILGWLLIFLGIIGWFLPIVPGTLLIFLGLALLSAQSEWVRDKIESFRVRFPRQAARMHSLKESLISKFKKEEPS